MDKEATPDPDLTGIEAMNAKAIENQLFTPDRVYIELELLKDFNIGTMYSDKFINGCTPEEFNAFKDSVIPHISEYQKRYNDSCDPYWSKLGYSDTRLAELIADQSKARHDMIFLMSPATKFLQTLARHTVRNQNNSRPAAKYVKTKISSDQYIMEPIPITYYFNTFPLSISPHILEKLGSELGEALGVNIKFLNKDPSTFDESDWNEWMKNIDCYYFHSLGRFLRSPFNIKTQGDFGFSGRYFFARKQFEKHKLEAARDVDFDQQIQMFTVQIDILCDFTWLQNNDVRLTEERENVPMDTPTEEGSSS